MSIDGLGLVSAPLGRRALSFGIDAALVAVLSVPTVIGYSGVIGALSSGTAPTMISVVLVVVGAALANVAIIAQLVLHGRRGITLGKRVTGIRSINVSTGERPGFWRVVLRALALGAAGSIVPVIGGAVMLASSLWSSNTLGRGWLDLIGGNWFVDARTGLNPYDATAMRLALKQRDSPAIDLSAAVPSLATGSADAVRFVPGSRSRSSVIGGVPTRPIADAPATVTPPIQPRDPAKAPGYVQPPIAPREPRALLEADDGARYELGAGATVGRNPAADAARPDRATVSLRDESFSISKSHAVLTVDAHGVWVDDSNSSNGTVVVGRDGAIAVVTPGSPRHAAWGDEVRLGDRSFIVRESTSIGGSPV